MYLFTLERPHGLVWKHPLPVYLTSDWLQPFVCLPTSKQVMKAILFGHVIIFTGNSLKRAGIKKWRPKTTARERSIMLKSNALMLIAIAVCMYIPLSDDKH